MCSKSKLFFAFIGISYFFLAIPLFGQGDVASCGASDFLNEDILRKLASTTDLTQARTGATEKLEYRIALDINHNTYLLYGGDKEKIKQVAYDYINRASEVFEREINVKLAVSYIHIWDKPEPYKPQTDFDYFGMVENYWNYNRFESRDAVVALSARGGWFYGGYRFCTANFPFPESQFMQADLLSHELGHTLGSPHTHSCYWPGGPIDYCENLEGTNSECNTNFRDYPRGSIMSYCRGSMSFHPLCRNLMRSFSEGSVNSDFKLKPIVNVTEAISFSIQFSESSATQVFPSFQIDPLSRSDKYRVQVAVDSNFNRIAEDIFVNQPFYHSTGLGSGVYYARVRAEVGGVSFGAWSGVKQFVVQQLSDNIIPPNPFNVKLHNDQSISGQFNNYEIAEAYEIEVLNLSTNTAKSYFLDNNQNLTSYFKVSYDFKLNDYLYLTLKLRIKSQGRWSRWSEELRLENPVNSEIWMATPTVGVSGTPVLVSSVYPSSLNVWPNTAIDNKIEIGSDSNFSDILFSDIKTFNQVNDRYTNLHVVNPSLKENSTYYLRSKLILPNEDDSYWKNATLTTGWVDNRFKFKSLVDNTYINQSYANELVSRFYKSKSGLYVYTRSDGYFYSEDLINWKAFFVPSTKGKTPASLLQFAAIGLDSTQLIENQGQIVTKRGNNYDYFLLPQGSWSYTAGHLATTKNEGIFYINNYSSVSRVFNGSIVNYYALFPNGVIRLAASKEEVWAIMAGGAVMTFKNGQWNNQPSINNWQSISGINFDEKNTPYVYGSMGVSFLDSQRGAWQEINALKNLPVKKVSFDGNGTIWAATYQFNNNNYINRSLIKVSPDGTANSYKDGLNFPNEAFDIEYFDKKLAILTNSGIVMTFDENQIQRFEPQQVYCPGDSIQVTLTTNSTFDKNSQRSLIFYKEAAQDSLSFNNLESSANPLQFIINEQIPAGNYFVRSATTSPKILSNESSTFRVAHGTPVTIKQENRLPYVTDITVQSDLPLNFQWYKNGDVMTGEKDKAIHLSQGGAFYVEAVNEYGCKTKSNTIHLELNEPESDLLLQNYPNPFGTSTEIAYFLKSDQKVKLELFNISGQLLKTLIHTHQNKGWHSYKLHSHEIENGIYLYRLTTENIVGAMKLLKI